MNDDHDDEDIDAARGISLGVVLGVVIWVVVIVMAWNIVH